MEKTLTIMSYIIIILINSYLSKQFFRKNSCKNFYTIKKYYLNFPKNNNNLNKGGT